MTHNRRADWRPTRQPAMKPTGCACGGWSYFAAALVGVTVLVQVVAGAW